MRYKFKTGMTAVLVLAFVLTMFSFTYPASAKTSHDVLGKAKILSALGIISESAEDFVSKETITRQEAARLMVKMSGADESQLKSKNTSVYFKDVDDKSEFALYIKAALERGIINGNGDYIFEPNRDVTYNEFVKMAVVVLGYNVHARLDGGYPSGYLKVASKLKLKSSTAKEVIDGSIATELLYSMLDAECAYISGVVGDKVTYSTDENKTLLTEYLKVYRVEGIVNGNEKTELYGKSSVASGWIQIDGVQYKYDGNASEFLGKEVEAYYRDEESNGENSIIYIGETNRNDTIICDADDITLSGTTFTYYDEKDRQKTVKLTSGAAIIYNERAVTDTSFDLNRLIPSEGNVTFIDNNNDNKYEVIKVISYTDVVVESADAYNDLIYDKYMSERNLKLKNHDYEIIDSENGKTVDIGKLAEYDVLSVMESDDGCFYILRSGKTVKGAIEKIEETDKVLIDGTEYKLSKSYLTSNQKELKVGDTGTFMIDAYGRIAGINLSSSSGYQVGLMKRIWYDISVSDYPQTKIYTVLGEEQTFDFADKVKVDGVRMKSSLVNNGENAVVRAIRNGQEGYNDKLLEELPEGQLVRYKLNSEKKICEIDTVYKNAAAGEDGNSLTRSIDYETGNKLFYKLQGKNLGGKELVSSSTIVFVLSFPFIGDDEYDFRITSGGYFADNTNYNIESYTYTEDKISADVILCYKDFTSNQLDSSAKDILVDKVGVMADEDGDVKKTISGWSDGTYTTVAVSNNALNNVKEKYNREIQKGDYINFSTNSVGDMNIIDLVYDSVSDRFAYTKNGDEYVYASGSGDFGEGFRYAYGLLYRCFGKDIVMSRTLDTSSISDSQVCDKLTVDTSNIYVYDKDAPKRDQVRLGTMADLIPYTRDNLEPSRIIVRTSYAKVVNVLIIK
jgi:hypothetical protein